jgi:hypothetical protein
MSGFGNEPVMREAERRRQPYLFKLRLTRNVKHGIAERGRLDNAAQVLDPRRVPARQMPPAATLAALPAFRQGAA